MRKSCRLIGLPTRVVRGLFPCRAPHSSSSAPFTTLCSNVAQSSCVTRSFRARFKPFKLPIRFRGSVCLLEVSGLFATSHNASDNRLVYLTKLCDAPRFSQPLDASFRLCACSLIACCCHVQAFAVQGFLPSKQPSFLSKGLAPLPFTSKTQTYLRRPCLSRSTLRLCSTFKVQLLRSAVRPNKKIVSLFRFHASPGSTRKNSSMAFPQTPLTTLLEPPSVARSCLDFVLSVSCLFELSLLRSADFPAQAFGPSKLIFRCLPGGPRTFHDRLSNPDRKSVV